MESPRSPKAGPRICKPETENRLQQQNHQQEIFGEAAPAVRGRRKPLYSVPNRSEQPPQIPPKPAIAPKPRNITSAPSIGANKRIPGSPRGTRSTQLRQATKTKMNSPPSPKITPPKYKQTADPYHHQLTTPKSAIPRGRAPLASPAPSTISSASSTTSSTNSSKLVRQGTFTKEEGCTTLTGNPVLVDIDVGDKKPPKKPNAGSNKARSPRSLTVGSIGDVIGGPPVIPQTRTSALRERSRSRQGSGSSTTSSNRSIPRPNTNSQNSSLKQSNSNQSLNSSRLGRRTPTNVDIVRTGSSKVPPVKDIPDTVSESAVTSKKSTGKKIESRIASLWKKVEDNKKKDKPGHGLHPNHIAAKEKSSKDSKKVWISKGRVIPENEMAFLRPDEQQKKLIKDFQKAKADSSLNDSSTQSQQQANVNSSSSSIGTNAGSKTRSRSRLSMKLPKFNSSSSKVKDTNSGFKKENSFTFTSHAKQHPNAHPTPAPRTNYSSSPHHPYGTPCTTTSASVPSTPTVEDVLNGNNHHEQQQNVVDHHTITAMDADSKRISRTGSFVNPIDGDHKHRKAIVQPFNYINPNVQIQQIVQVNDQDHDDLVDDPKKLRRNDSYVSSMGRTREEMLAASAARKRQALQQAAHLEVQDESILDVDDKGAQHTDSVLVTLV